MEEKADASEADAADPDPSPEPSPAPSGLVRRAGFRPLARSRHLRPSKTSSPCGLAILFLLLGVAFVTLGPSPARGDALERVRRSGRLLYGSDMEGGGPYAFPDPDSPRGVTGFEVELMALLARDLGAEPIFSQGQW